jgi:hypothetical protein
MDYTRGSNANQSLVLNYENHLHVEEDVVIGTVDINLALLQEQRIDKVHIKLRGAAVTWVHIYKHIAYRLYYVIVS